MVVDNEKEKLDKMEEDYSFIKECLWQGKARKYN